MSDQEELFKYWLKFKDISTRLFGNKRKRVNEPLVLHGNDRFLCHHYCIDSNYYLLSGKVNSELCTCAFYDYNNPDLASSYSYDHQYFHDEKQLISKNKCLDNQDGSGGKYLKVELLDCSVEFENFQKDLKTNTFSNNLLCCYKNMVIAAMGPDLVLQKQPSGILMKINLESIVSKACKHFLNNYKSAFMEYNETLGNEVLGKSWEITFMKIAKFYGKDLLMLCLTNGFVFCAFCEDVYQNETFEPLFQLKTELSCWSIDIFDDGPIKVFAVGSNERTVTLFFHDSHNKEIQPNKSNIVYKIGRIPCSDNVPTVAFYPKRTSEGNAILYYGNIIGQIVSVKIFLKPNNDYKGTNFTDEPFAYKYLNSQFLGTQCWSISLLFENEICKDFLKVSSWEELTGCPNKTINSIQEHNVLQDYLILDNLRYDDFDGHDKTVKTYGTGAKIARIPVPTQSLLERCVIYDDNNGFISTEVHINSGELGIYPFDTFDEYTNLYGIGENELCYNDLRAPGKNGILTEHMRRKFDKLYTKIKQQRNKKTEKKIEIQDLISITNPIASSAEQGISEFLKDRAQEVGDIVQVSFNSILSKADKFVDAFDFIYNYHLAGYDMRNYYPGPILRIGEFLEQYGINTRKYEYYTLIYIFKDLAQLCIKDKIIPYDEFFNNVFQKYINDRIYTDSVLYPYNDLISYTSTERSGNTACFINNEIYKIRDLYLSIDTTETDPTGSMHYRDEIDMCEQSGCYLFSTGINGAYLITGHPLIINAYTPKKIFDISIVLDNPQINLEKRNLLQYANRISITCWIRELNCMVVASQAGCVSIFRLTEYKGVKCFRQEHILGADNFELDSQTIKQNYLQHKIDINLKYGMIKGLAYRYIDNRNEGSIEAVCVESYALLYVYHSHGLNVYKIGL